MTPKEKAEDLLSKYYFQVQTLAKQKQCALIAVDEILDATVTEYQIQYDNGEWSREIGFRYSQYWQEVKQEIKKL